ncbi:MAG: DUF5050 domain-containing protein [Dethiosulfatibacter sp.]|nr:DUF5050 domain-containing protein [Dethiosulfatibacter sp.]
MKERKEKTKITLMIILVLMSIGLLTLTSCEVDDEVTTPPVIQSEGNGFLAGNIGQGGLMAGDSEGKVYYRSESDHWALYKANLDGSEKMKLSDDRISNINVLGGWVYYTNFDDNFSVYKIRTDGSDRQRIFEGYCSNLYVAGDRMYFDMRDESNMSHVYSLGTDGSDLKKIIPEASMAYYYDEAVYYISNNGLSLWKLNLETDVNIKLTDKYSTYVLVDDTGIYYWSVNEGTFNQMNLDGGDERVVLSGGDYYNTSSQDIYYIKSSDNYDLFRLDLETESEERLSSFSSKVFDENGEVIEDLTNLSEYDFSFQEKAAFIYLIEGDVFSRGTLVESLSKSGKVDCLMHFDDEGNAKFWD